MSKENKNILGICLVVGGILLLLNLPYLVIQILAGIAIFIGLISIDFSRDFRLNEKITIVLSCITFVMLPICLNEQLLGLWIPFGIVASLTGLQWIRMISIALEEGKKEEK